MADRKTIPLEGITFFIFPVSVPSYATPPTSRLQQRRQASGSRSPRNQLVSPSVRPSVKASVYQSGNHCFTIRFSVGLCVVLLFTTWLFFVLLLIPFVSLSVSLSVVLYSLYSFHLLSVHPSLYVLSIVPYWLTDKNLVRLLERLYVYPWGLMRLVGV